jgi:hypothetical protein
MVDRKNIIPIPFNTSPVTDQGIAMTTTDKVAMMLQPNRKRENILKGLNW